MFRARLDYFVSVAVAVVCTAISVPFRLRLQPTDFAMVYVLGVIVVSAKCRRSAAILNAVLSVSAFYYFLLPFHDSFVLEDYTYLITLIAMSTVALVISTLTHKIRFQAAAVAQEQVRNSLLNAVSHDLKTPLSSIYGAATTLLEEETRLLGPERRELIESIAEEAERLNRVVTNLLEITRLESGIELQKDWQPLEEIIGAALTRLNKTLGDRPVAIQIADDVPLIFVDDVLLEEVFINLLENVVKYTPVGTPVEIVANRAEGRLSISIRDRGPGFVPGDEERIFQKFYRGKTEGARGVGLGLAICRVIINAHGGTISAHNSAVGGAVVKIELPMQPAPPEIRVLSEGTAQ